MDQTYLVNHAHVVSLLIPPMDGMQVNAILLVAELLTTVVKDMNWSVSKPQIVKRMERGRRKNFQHVFVSKPYKTLT